MNRRIKMNSERQTPSSAVSTDAELEAALRALEDMPHNVDTEISNLPASNFTLTQEILKNNVCRLCATYYETGPNLVPLYIKEDNSAKRTLAEIASDFLPIRLRQGDGLPEVACASCEQELIAWRRMYSSCADAQKILFSQAERTSGIHFYSRNDKLLTEVVESVLATYPSTGSMELVCHKCELKTSSDMFYQHLSSKHDGVRNRDDVESFVRDHVTFEESLDSDFDENCTTLKSLSSEAIRLDCPPSSTSFTGSSRILSEHDVNVDNISRDDFSKHQRKKCRSVPSRCKSRGRGRSGRGRVAADARFNASLSQVKYKISQRRIPAVCPNCNRTYINKYTMRKHMKTFCGEFREKYECECGRSYTSRSNLLAHTRIVHLGLAPPYHTCTECGAMFRSRASREAHCRVHSGVRPFSCTICGRSFYSKAMLMQHQKTHEPPQYECQFCEVWFRRRSGLKSHMRTHEHDDPDFDWNFYSLKRRPDSRSRLMSVAAEDSPDRDSDDSRTPLAELAPRDPMAALRRALRDLRDHHAERHESRASRVERDPQPQPGPVDDLTRRNMRRDRFDEATRRALDAARVRVDGAARYACPQCGRRLASPHAFVHHARIHSGERPHVCHVCGKRFRAPQGLARHLAETHERRRRRACRLCRRTFANDQNLRQHLRTHTGERPYQCPECGRRFAQSGSLHAHRRTHSPRRAFACPDCGAAFRLRAGLARHALRHAGARPHRCGCGRAFAARHELAAHLPLHGEASPHACALCPAAYKLRRALRDHARRAHTPAPAELTRDSFPGATAT